MGLNSTKILGINVTTDSKKKILEEIEKYLNAGISMIGKKSQKAVKPLVIVTPNPEQIVFAQSDRDYADILNRAHIAVPDGSGIVWASRVLSLARGKSDGIRISQRIPGVELMEDLLPLAVKNAVTIGLIGGWDGVALKALERLQTKYPGLQGWADEPSTRDIVSDTYKRVIGDRIHATKTGMVFVGLGAPKQEKFVESLLSKTSHKTPLVLMSIGGSLDVLSGKKRRAPFLLRAIGVEWLWRLVREPWRWKRQLSLAKFIWLVGKKRKQGFGDRL